MKRNIKIIVLITAITLVLAQILTACTGTSNEHNRKSKITIIATLFPQYDFSREIAGDKAEIRLLLPPGMESHSYEPTPSDIVSISKSDIFLYTGDDMEPWAKTILNGIETNALIVNVSSGIELKKEDEHDDDDEHEHEHEHEFDAHIWTDPINAKVMVKNIEDALASVDSENAQYYHENAEMYIKELDELDKQFSEVAQNARVKTICFGGRFAMRYFADRYGFDYIAAYDSCSGETEPSAKAVAEIIDAVKEQNIKVIYYEELVDSSVADSIAKEAGAESMLLHSCHNLSKADFDAGETYISLMKKNVEALKYGLN